MVAPTLSPEILGAWIVMTGGIVGGIVKFLTWLFAARAAGHVQRRADLVDLMDRQAAEMDRLAAKCAALEEQHRVAEVARNIAEGLLLRLGWRLVDDRWVPTNGEKHA